MPKYVLIFSFIVLAATAYLGYQTKLAIDEKNRLLTVMTKKYHEELDLRIKTQKELKETQDLLAAATKTIEDQKSQITTLETSLAASKAETETAKAQVTDLTTQLETANKKIAQLENPTPDPSAPPSPVVQKLMEEKAELEKGLAESKQVQETLRQREKSLTENLASANLRIQHYEKPVHQAGMTANIVSVNPGWNFVVLNVGDKQGVSVNAPLFVMRGGQMIAQLKVTSVEPRTAIADVVPGTMVRGTQVQAGDRVVFAGVRNFAAPLPGAAGAVPETAVTPAAPLVPAVPH